MSTNPFAFPRIQDTFLTRWLPAPVEENTSPSKTKKRRRSGELPVSRRGSGKLNLSLDGCMQHYLFASVINACQQFDDQGNVICPSIEVLPYASDKTSAFRVYVGMHDNICKFFLHSRAASNTDSKTTFVDSWVHFPQFGSVDDCVYETPGSLFELSSFCRIHTDHKLQERAKTKRNMWDVMYISKTVYVQLEGQVLRFDRGFPVAKLRLYASNTTKYMSEIMEHIDPDVSLDAISPIQAPIPTQTTEAMADQTEEQPVCYINAENVEPVQVFEPLPDLTNLPADVQQFLILCGGTVTLSDLMSVEPIEIQDEPELAVSPEQDLFLLASVAESKIVSV